MAARFDHLVVAVEDLDDAAARWSAAGLPAAGFEPGPAVPGSRRTPDGDVLEWQVCDLGPGPYDGSLPFLIEWERHRQ